MKKHIKSSLLIVFLATPLLGRAAGIPTIDVANILQTTISALESVQQTANQIEQIANQIDQFNKLQEQLDQQFAQFESITGDYGLSDLLNGPNQQAARRAIPTSWQETLALLESGSAPGHQQDFLNAAVRAQEELQTYQPGDIYEDVDAEIAQKRIADANSAFAQFGVGEGNYNEADRRTETVEGLIGSIAAQNDLKAAIDLNNRLAGENALLLSQLIKLIASSHINDAEQRINEVNRAATDTWMSNPFIPELP